MKHFVFITSLFLVTASTNAQKVYNTSADGNWTANSTWTGGSADIPPTSGNCNCIININEGHRVTLNQTVDISNAKIVLHAAESEIRFATFSSIPPSNPQSLHLTGTSSINIKHGGASIASTSTNSNGNTITISGTTVFQGGSTMVNSATPGTVNGPASATSAITPPSFTNSVLPVVLSEFNVFESGGKTSITWKTDQEINSDRFELERSPNGKDWNIIGTIKAAGNLSVAKNYSFLDGAPSNGVNYYRLKIVDIDTKFEYSKVKTITVSIAKLVVSINPNPASSVLYISVSQPSIENYNIRLTNRSGQIIFSQKYSGSNGRISLNVASFAEGTYFAEVSNDAGFRQTSKVIIGRK